MMELSKETTETQVDEGQSTTPKERVRVKSYARTALVDVRLLRPAAEPAECVSKCITVQSTTTDNISLQSHRLHSSLRSCHSRTHSQEPRLSSITYTLLVGWLISLVTLRRSLTPAIADRSNRLPDWASSQPIELITSCTDPTSITALLMDYHQPDLWFIRTDSSTTSTLSRWNSTSGACELLTNWTATQVSTPNFNPCLDQDPHTGYVYFSSPQIIYQAAGVNTAGIKSTASQPIDAYINIIVNVTASGFDITNLVVDDNVLFFTTLDPSDDTQSFLYVYNLTTHQYLGTYDPTYAWGPIGLSINRDFGRRGEVLALAGSGTIWSFNLSLIHNLSQALTEIITPAENSVQGYRLTESMNLILFSGSDDSTTVQLLNGTTLTTLFGPPTIISFNPVIDQTNEQILFVSTTGILFYDLKLRVSFTMSNTVGCGTLNAIGSDQMNGRVLLGCSSGLFYITGRSVSTAQFRSTFMDLAIVPATGTVIGLTQAALHFLNGLDSMIVSLAQTCAWITTVTLSSEFIFVLCQPHPFGSEFTPCVLRMNLTTYQPIDILPGSCNTTDISVTADDSMYLSRLSPDGFTTQLFYYNITHETMDLVYQHSSNSPLEVAMTNRTMDGLVTLWIISGDSYLVNMTHQKTKAIDFSPFGCQAAIGLEAASDQLFIYCTNLTTSSLLVWNVSQPGTSPIVRVYSNVADQFSGWTVDPFSSFAYFTLASGQLMMLQLETRLSWTFEAPCTDVTQVGVDRVSGVATFTCYEGTVISVSNHYRCSPGFAWTSGACVPCAAGTFSGLIDQRTGPSLSFCSPCAIGSVAPQLGSVACDQCPLGRYQDPTQFQTCSVCPSGSYQNITGSTVCEICPVGTYASEPGSSVCTLCSPGTFTSTNNTVVCQVCQIGRISTQPGAIECDICPSGTYAPDVELTVCSLCTPGSFSLTNQSSNCQSCYRNSYSTVYGLNTTCQLCPPGKEALSLGATTCTTCVLGSYSLSGDSCRTCPLGEYVPSPGLPCITCLGQSQSGLYCINGLASVKRGYWPYQIWSEEFNTMIYQTTPCPTTPCPGTQLQFLNSSLINGTDPSTQITYCRFPRDNSPSNWLCGGCSVGYIPWGDMCDQCTQTNIGMVIGLLIFSIILVLFLYRSGTSSAGHLAILIFFLQTAALELDSVSTYLEWLQFVNFGSNSIHTCLAPLTPLQQQFLTFSIPLILIMILGLLCGLHAAIFYWHQRAKSDADVADPLDGDLQNTIESASINPSSPSTSSSTGPPSAYLLMEWYRLQTKFSLFRYLGCIGSILLFCYTSVTVAIVKSLHCVEVAPGVILLNSIPTVDCSSAEYRSFLPVIYAWLVIYVIGLPVFMGLFLFIHRQRLHPPSTDPLFPANLAEKDSAVESSADSSPVAHAHRKSTVGQETINVHIHAPPTNLSPPMTPLTSSKTPPLSNYFPLCFGAFYLGFSSRCSYYWQPILLLRRFAFALVAVLLSDTNTLYAVFTLLHVSTLLLHVWSQPFSDVQLNQIESASYLILIYVSVLLNSTTPPYSIWLQVLLFLLVVPSGVALIIWTLKHQLKWLKRQFNKFQRRQRQLKKVTTQYHSPTSPIHHHHQPFDHHLLDEYKDESNSDIQSNSASSQNASLANAASSVVAYSPSLTATISVGDASQPSMKSVRRAPSTGVGYGSLLQNSPKSSN